MVDEGWGVGGGPPALLPLAIEDPERIGLEAVAVLGTQLLSAVGQVAPEEIQIGRTTDGVPHRVDPQIEGGQAQVR